MKHNKNSVYYYNYNMRIYREEQIKKTKKRIIIAIVFLTIVLIIVSKIIENNVKEANAREAIAIAEQKNKEMQEQLELKKKQEEEEARLAYEAKLPKLTDDGIKNLENIYHSEEKVAYLTFDDGPSDVTEKILDTLKKEDIKATFFVLGTNVKNFPEVTKKIFDEGHFIANHGYTHVYSSIYSSKEAVLDEFNKCNDAVKEALNEPRYNSHLFRFPGGLAGGKYADIKKEAKQLLNDNGILNVDWNALSGDAEKQSPTPEYLMDRIKTTTEGKNSIVVLMHDASFKKVTAEKLPEIIAYLREQGYTFKSFYDVIK